MRKKILCIGGSRNQTTMVHKIARELRDHDVFFTPFYTDGALRHLIDSGLLDFTIMAGPMRRETEAYLREQRLPVDFGGRSRRYDLVMLGTDLIVPNNINGAKIVLVQEGMTDPENLMYYLVRWLKLPRYLASTATTGLSGAYDVFCVASHGYRDHFLRKGIAPEKLVVTGIPNFDDVRTHLDNDFPHHGHVLVATSDTRECFKIVNRRRFFENCRRIAAGRPVIFKLHPNENAERSTREIRQYFPSAPIYTAGKIEPMIANCDVLITQYSSVVYVGIALGKEVHSYFDVEKLKRLCPVQNGGRSAANIASVCRQLLEEVSESEAPLQKAAS
jgi:hypothetical protein